jgi:hypothetical protein
MRTQRSFCALLALAVFVPASTSAVDDDYNYRQHGNRMEGLRRIPTSGSDVDLLSFIACRERISTQGGANLRIGFYVPSAGAVHLIATEIGRHGPSHYQMRPLQKTWDAGWQEFGPWPTTDVLVPLGIPLESIGVVARVGTESEGSGAITPVALYANSRPTDCATYSMWLLPTNTLSTLDVVVASAAGHIFHRDRLLALPANAPFQVTFSLKAAPDGEYRAFLDGRELDRTTGPARRFTFHHQASPLR